MKRNPAISVVMPIFNAVRWIEQTLECVLAQTCQDFELILVDDGSTDGTTDILRRFACADPRITLIIQANARTGAALNAGFAVARGKYQTWWSADSWPERSWLKQLKTALDDNPDVGFVYGDITIFYESSQQHVTQLSPEFDRDRLQRECYVGVCWMWRREVKEACGDWVLHTSEDFDMWLRMADVCDFLHVPKVLGHWRHHGANLSDECNRNEWKDVRRIVSRHKWQRHSDLRIAHVCPWIDAAGVAWYLNYGLNEIAPGVASRHILGKPSAPAGGFTLGQKDDLIVGQDMDEIYDVLRECDLIHCHVVLPDDRFSEFDFRPWIEAGKRILFHLHGGPWTWNRRKIADWQARYGMRVVSCDPGIAGMVPGATWMPNLIPLDTQERMWDRHLFRPNYQWPETPAKLRLLCHHAYATGKGVDLIREVVAQLAAFEGIEFATSLRDSDPVPIKTHLAEKQQADIVIDQLTQGFVGMAAWESLAQGAVVIARLDAEALREYTRLGNGTPPPILNVRGAPELAIALIDLAKHPERVLELKHASRAWAVKHYNADRIAGLWTKLYRDVVAKKPLSASPRLRVKSPVKKSK